MYDRPVFPFHKGVIMIGQADSKGSFSLLTQKYISQFSSKTIKKLSTFTLFFIPAFLLNHSVCVAFNIVSTQCCVSTESFTGGTYDHFTNFDTDGRLRGESFYNFRNNTGITANDFHFTLNYRGGTNANGYGPKEYSFPPGTAGNPIYPYAFSVPSGAYFSPSQFLGLSGDGISSLPSDLPIRRFLTNVYWTLDGKPLGDPPVPPIIVEPLISGFNSFCTEEYLPNVACNVGTLGDVPIAVPEPLNILGAGVALGFGVTFKRKLAKNFKIEYLSF